MIWRSTHRCIKMGDCVIITVEGVSVFVIAIWDGGYASDLIKNLFKFHA